MSGSSREGGVQETGLQFERAVHALHGLSQRALQAIAEAEHALRLAAADPHGRVANYDPWFRGSGRGRRVDRRPHA